jgi:chromosomal replication initiator protein
MTRSQRNELEEVFLFAFREQGLNSAIEAVGNAAALQALGVLRPSRRPALHPTFPALQYVARLLGTTPEILRLPYRNREVVEPRWLAMWLLRQPAMPWPKLSYPQIAKVLGLDDHTTVMHGVEMVERNVELLARAREICARVEKREAA